ncbi:hypothetical protein FB451DRAFT_1477575 [Mycena latifolia]|nr:hypothetical protein FB451DRAFT_1477575 [Mycena latifolia]
MKFALVAALSALVVVVSAQNSCTAVATVGGPKGETCTSLELGDAKQNMPGLGPCEKVPTAACVFTDNVEGACAIHLYSDQGCQTYITGGPTIMCGEPPQSVDFNSFQVEC